MKNFKIIGTLLALLLSMGAEPQCELVEESEMSRDATKFNKYFLHAWRTADAPADYEPTSRREYLVKEVSSQNREINLDELNLNPEFSWWVRGRGQTKGGALSSWSPPMDVAYKPKPTFLTKQFGVARFAQQTITTSYATIGFDEVIFDSHDNVSTSNNNFEIRRTGVYKISPKIFLLTASTHSSVNTVFLFYRINSETAEVFNVIAFNTSTSNQIQPWTGEHFITLEEGDVLEIGVSKAAATATLQVMSYPGAPFGNLYSNVSIEYIGVSVPVL
jgi:hypothetical protein